VSGLEFERPPVRPDPVALARLEHSHKEAVQAGIDLREQWKQEDAATAEARRFIWQAHEQGARDRDALRVKLGGRSLIEADAEAAREAAAARLKAADDAKAKLAAEAEAKAVQDAKAKATPTPKV
jgi:colicin import membrane protein